MEELHVQRYSAEVKVYIGATLILAGLIVGLVWWNASQDAKRQTELLALYDSYKDLSQHIQKNMDINGIAVCKMPKKIEANNVANNAKPKELTKTEIQEKQVMYAKQLDQHRIKVEKFTSHLTQQYSFLTKQKPANSNPELMSDALLYRLNKTYNDLARTMQKLGEKCGELSSEQVQMRKRRFNKAVARFEANLKDLKSSK